MTHQLNNLPATPSLINLHLASLDVPQRPVAEPLVQESCDPTLRIDQAILAALKCPHCSGKLKMGLNSFGCRSCASEYPIARGVPILVSPEKSLFDVQTFLNQDATFFRPVHPVREFISRWMPDVTLNVSSSRVFTEMRDRLLEISPQPRVLVVGGGVVGGGMDCLVDDPRIMLVETDAAIAPRTQLICDGHDLPFVDQCFDGVIVQAVLEHVLDPHRCVSEIHRVLKNGGLVYSDTPFIQQVHGRQYDFTRFTRLGHRRLFRQFDEIDSGISCGPGVALAWTIRYFLLSFFIDQKLRAAASLLSRLCFWPLKYFDYYLAGKPSAYDAASAFYFFGRRSESSCSDRDLVASYHGGF